MSVSRFQKFPKSLLSLALLAACGASSAYDTSDVAFCSPLYVAAGAIPGQADCPTTAYTAHVGLGSYNCVGTFALNNTIPAFCANKPIDPPQSCKAGGQAGAGAGNPIIPATAEKLQVERDWVGTGPQALSFTRTYRSRWGDVAPAAGLGNNWSHEHAIRNTVSGNTAIIQFGDGSLQRFSRSSITAPWVAAAGSSDTLVLSPTGSTYRRVSSDTTYQFNASGQLLSQTQRNGWTTSYTYTYTNNLLTRISNAFGRAITLAYNTSGLLTSVTTPDGQTISYQYDSTTSSTARLTSARNTDNTSKTYGYANTAFPQAMTSITDENNRVFASFAYDTQGRAISTEYAGAANRYQIAYGSATLGDPVSITDPLGTSRTYGYGTQSGALDVTSASSAAPGQARQTDIASRTQDANGLVTSETDFLGIPTTTTWDTTRRLPLSVTRAAGKPEAVTTTTQWHASFNLPVLVTEKTASASVAARTTAYTYDANGNRLSQAVTDPATGKVQTTQWTYNAQGLVATEVAPNGGVTRYTYDTTGNPTQVSNALGQVTSYAYDTAGRVTSQTEPNGLVSLTTYDARGRVLTLTRGGLKTTLSYTPSGQIASLAQPNGCTLSYSYDAAQRLIGWSDNRGASGVYTLDGMGNRTQTLVKNSAGQIVWQSATSINSQNLPVSTAVGATGAAVETTSYVYNSNGDRTGQANALNQATGYGLDNLKRVTAITKAANNAVIATAAVAYNALDAVVGTSDFKGVATGYARDAQGNPLAENNTDQGNRSTVYDALGLPQKITDALGVATSITRDLLGRPTLITYADSKTTTLRYDLPGADYNAPNTPNASIGYLSEIVDRNNETTRYQRDSLGRVVGRLLIRPNEVLSGITNVTILEVAHHAFGVLLQHGHVVIGRLA